MSLFLRFALLSILTLLVASCDRVTAEIAPLKAGKPSYVATIPPVGLILQEIVGDRGTVTVLLSPSASAHTYAPRPSDARASAAAAALFYASPGVDAWAAKLQSPVKVELMSLLPESFHLPNFCTSHGVTPHAHDHGHDHGEADLDGHFWMDPLAVEAMVPGIVERLTAVDPEGAAVYAANGERFLQELTMLDAELSAQLAPLYHAPVVLFHPSINYMLQRYDLEFAGVVEAFPGKQPSPRYLADLKATVEAKGIRAIFTEPQLNPGPAKVLAEGAGVELSLLDPYGGPEDRADYAALLRFNAKALVEALGTP